MLNLDRVCGCSTFTLSLGVLHFGKILKFFNEVFPNHWKKSRGTQPPKILKMCNAMFYIKILHMSIIFHKK